MNLTQYFDYELVERTQENGIPVPVSRAPISGPDHRRITIAWDKEVADPEGAHSANGWSILYGPCFFTVTAHVMLMGMVPECSMHIGAYEATVVDGVDKRVKTYHCPEWAVLPHETSHSHLMGTWNGFLAEGRRLRIDVDYWNAPDGAVGRITKAQVSGFYGRE